jgi:ferredoxin
VELAPAYFRMSKKDGKTVLIHSEEKRGFYTLKITDNTEFETCELAANACPVKIISTKLI